MLKQCLNEANAESTNYNAKFFFNIDKSDKDVHFYIVSPLASVFYEILGNTIHYCLPYYY